jgi:acetyl esterase/lipase
MYRLIYCTAFNSFCWLFFICLFGLPAHTQSKVVSLYTGQIPGAHTTAVPEKKELFLGKIPIVRYVTKPTLTIFPAVKQKNTGTAVIICPGGAYGFLAYETEGNEVALRFQQLGVTAFVLKYRLPDKRFQENPALAPLQDVQQALRLIRRQASDWGIKSERVGIIGFSAGGHLASTAGTHFDRLVLPGPDSLSVRPDFMVLIYPVISFSDSLTHAGSRANLLGEQLTEQQLHYFSNERHVTSKVPPTMLVHCADDLTVSIRNSLVFYQACLQAKVPVEMHLYPKGGHGFGLHNSAKISK